MMGTTFDDTTTEAHMGLRLDVYLAGAIEDVSRSIIQRFIKEGLVEVNGAVCQKSGRSMAAGDRVVAVLPAPPNTDLLPQAIPLSILYEDSDLLVIDKPSGLVVHPAPGHPDGTLVNAVLHHCPDFQKPGDDLGRPGIVHRLDRFTSGVMLVAKSHAAFAGLAEQAREHTFDRRYLALVRGEFKENTGRINASVGRSLHDRGRMSVTGVNARDAITRFEVLERFRVASLVSLVLETGRTHQIRVHMRFAGHPVLGDPVYGVTEFGKWDVPDLLLDALKELEGQALHAERLGFTHPVTKKRLTFTAPPPADFQRVLGTLRSLHAAH
ncbi:MAG: RluA family pseudouridine synthase [Candidatus Hydrogenedentales bacterium]|jgi:23S rRNA pseudouridine1911/1915/1917 synthase